MCLDVPRAVSWGSTTDRCRGEACQPGSGAELEYGGPLEPGSGNNMGRKQLGRRPHHAPDAGVGPSLRQLEFEHFAPPTTFDADTAEWLVKAGAGHQLRL